MTDKAREARNAYKRKWYKENPEKRFIAIGDLECADMKKVTLENLYETLKDLKNEVTVPEDVANRARKAIEAMLAVS